MKSQQSFFPALAPLTGSSVSGPQFQDETSSRFPAPPPGDYSDQITIGDLDADTDLDLIFANGGGFFSAGSPDPRYSGSRQ